MKGACEEEEGENVTPGVSFLCSPQRFPEIRGRRGGGGTTDVPLPSERGVFDGDSGACRVARGANSKYYNTTRCSLQTAASQFLRSHPAARRSLRGYCTYGSIHRQ